MDKLELYSYWRSSASYRVRLALHYKSMQFETKPIHLVNNGGEQHQTKFKEKNAFQLVPVLKVTQPDGLSVLVRQSLAIIEFLDHLQPNKRLIPEEPILRCQINALCHDIAMETHPLCNLRVLQYLKQKKSSQSLITDWMQHWLTCNLTCLNTELVKNRDVFQYLSDNVTLFQCVLLPQLYNARRFDVDTSKLGALLDIEKTVFNERWAVQAAPAEQPDAE